MPKRIFGYLGTVMGRQQKIIILRFVYSSRFSLKNFINFLQPSNPIQGLANSFKNLCNSTRRDSSGAAPSGPCPFWASLQGSRPNNREPDATEISTKFSIFRTLWPPLTHQALLLVVPGPKLWTVWKRHVGPLEAIQNFWKILSKIIFTY